MLKVTAAVTPKGERRRYALVSAAADLLCAGGFDAVLNFLFGAGTRNYVFGVAAFAVMCVLGLRIYRRIRPPETKRKRDPNAPPNFLDFFRFDVWRDPNKD